MKKLAAFLVIVFCQASFSLVISVYHTSDVHGWYMSRPAKWDKENSTRSVGGFAALSALVKTDKNPYILLDSGDMFQGTPEGNFTKGMATVEYMNSLGYSAGLVGNHDYDFGEENLKNLIAAAKFPLLGANVYYKKDGPEAKTADYLKPYILIEKAGKKIAILGIAGEHTSTSTLPQNVKHLTFGFEPKEAEKYMKEINAIKPDAVIILAHVGILGRLSQQKTDISTWTLEGEYGEHSTIAIERAAKTASVIFGGHNHTGLLKDWKDPQTGTAVCESYWGLTDVTKADLNFDDKTGKLSSVSCSLLPLWTDKTGEDAAVLKITSRTVEATSQEMDKIVGEAEANIGMSKETPDTPVGNWMTDVMREYAGTDMAFQNSGGIRNPINKGVLRLRDIYQVMPFENTLVKLQMTGEQIERLIKDNLRDNRTGMQISGLTVKYSTDAEGKISSLEMEKDGKPIKPEDKFSVATNNYLTTGGTGGRVFMESQTNDTMIPIRDILINHVKEKKKISSPGVGRFLKAD